LKKAVGTRNNFKKAKKNYVFLTINYPALPKAPLAPAPKLYAKC